MARSFPVWAAKFARWHLGRTDGSTAREPGANKTPEELGWKSIRLQRVPTYPHRINPLSLLPDGRLCGTGDDYVGSFLFDPRDDKTTYLGPRTGLAPYTTIVCGGKLYFSGYPGGPLFVYNPARPWTLGKDGGRTRRQSSPAGGQTVLL